MTRLGTAVRLRIAALARQPVTLAMLVVLPPVVVELYGVAVGSFPQLPAGNAPLETVGRAAGALFGVAFLAGLVGLFQVVSARSGDERAAIAGFPRPTMLAGRLVTTVVVAIAGAAVAFATFASSVDVAAPALAFGVLVLAGVLYGLLGVVVGTLVPRELEGSIVLVFLADLDNALSSGLFAIDATTSLPVVGEVGVTDVVPLYHPHELFLGATLDGDLPAGHLVPTLAWILALLAVAFVAYTRATGAGAARSLGEVVA